MSGVETQNAVLATDDELVEHTCNDWKYKPLAVIRGEEERLLTIMQDASEKRKAGEGLLGVSGLDGTSEKEKNEHFVKLHSILSGVVDARDHARRVEATIAHHLDHANGAQDNGEGGAAAGNLADMIQQMIAEHVEQAIANIDPSLVQQAEQNPYSFYDALAADSGIDGPMHGRAHEYVTRSPQRGYRLSEVDRALAAVFRTSAGFPPDVRRRPGWVPSAERPAQVVDAIPRVDVTQNSVEYAAETLFTNAAAAVAEGAAVPESSLQITNQVVPIQDIGCYMPVTINQLDDEEQARMYLDERLPFMVRQKLDEQVINGDGTAPNLTGFLSKTGTATRELSDDAKPIDDFLEAKVIDVEKGGRAMASMAVVEHAAWVQMATSKGNDNYFLGNPGIEFTPRIWSMPVVLCDHGLAFANANDKLAIVGDFLRFSYLAMRRDMTIQIGWKDDDLTKRQVTLVAWLRAALVITRAAAFAVLDRKT